MVFDFISKRLRLPCRWPGSRPEEQYTLDNLNLRHFRGLDQSEAGLVRQSIVGAHITCDAKADFVG